MRRYILGICLGSFLLAVGVNDVCAEDRWHEQKGNHFIIKFQHRDDRQWSKQVLRKAEKYYTTIADQLGYARYQDFWTWDNRTLIIVYKDKQTFVKSTGFPAWSGGVAFREQQLFNTRTIVTYKQEKGFLNGVLPHEISHLILRDFLGKKMVIPLWFDEGIAQMFEGDRREQSRRIMTGFVRKDAYIPMKKLIVHDIRQEKEAIRVALFYAQSVSVIDFLLKKYGSSKFALLCTKLRDGYDFEGALKSAYQSSVKSVDDLEEKWLKFLSSS